MRPAIILIFTLLLFLLVAGFFYNHPRRLETKLIKINGAEFLVEVADEAPERSRGLSEKDSLAENEGILFVFEKPDFYSFWMRDMKFAIDIIWLDENLKIVGITPQIQPESFPKTFFPPQPVQYVLEIKAGAAEEKNIKIGDMMVK